MILDLIAEAQVEGLNREQACEVLDLAPRTLQRWRAAPASVPAIPSAGQRPRPYNALTACEAAAVVALIQSPRHADASCRELALALLEGPEPTYISHVTAWQYQRALDCNGPRGRQVSQGRGRQAPETDWVQGPNQLWDWDITYLLTLECQQRNRKSADHRFKMSPDHRAICPLAAMRPGLNRLCLNRLLRGSTRGPSRSRQGRRPSLAPSRREAERSGAPLTARRATDNRPAEGGSAQPQALSVSAMASFSGSGAGSLAAPARAGVVRPKRPARRFSFSR